VLRGLCGNTVSSRKARRHYGVSVSSPFDVLNDPATCKVWDPCEDEWTAKNRMSWFVSKESAATDEIYSALINSRAWNCLMAKRFLFLSIVSYPRIG
jgi:hypothetical protein